MFKMRALVQILYLLFALLPVVLSAAIPGDVLSNTATSSYSAGVKKIQVSSNETNVTVVRSPSSIEFLRYFKTGADENLSLRNTKYFDGSHMSDMDPPRAADGTLLDFNNITPAVVSSTFGGDDLILIRVTDLDQNEDNTAIDTIELNISNGTDIELIELRETSPSSGVFVGYIRTNTESVTQADGLLSVDRGDSITAIYRDELDVVTSSTADATIVFYSHVFLARDGRRLDGIEVSLVDASSGTLLDSTVTQNSGEYIFYNIPAGRYILGVNDPKNIYHAPSVYAPSETSKYGFVVYDDGSYSKPFINTELPSQTNAGARASAVIKQLRNIDIPMDDLIYSISIQKSASKQVASVGEFIKFTLFIENSGDADLVDVNVTDMLPTGLKYETLSAKLDTLKIKTDLSLDGKTIRWQIGNLPASASRTLTYVAQVGTGIKGNKITNQAIASSKRIESSNIATATVKIEEELWRNRAFIVGQIINQDQNSTDGIEGVRVYLEDGTYTNTDRDGKYHFEALSIGTHVVQVDQDSLRDGVELVECTQNPRAALRTFSRFVDLRQGAIKRVDFCLKGSIKIDRVVPDLNETKDSNTMPEYSPSTIRNLKDPPSILWPPKRYVPSIPTTKIAVLHSIKDSAQLWLNSEQVSLLNYDSQVVDKRSGRVLTIYKGVDLLAGKNSLEVLIKDQNGKVLKRAMRSIHVSGAPVKLRYLPELSTLVADGKNSPIIAVQLFDKDNYPVRTTLKGSYSIEEPYISQDSIDKLSSDPLGLRGSEDRYTVGAHGVAYIRLQPTTRAGEATLHFDLDGRTQSIRAWLSPKAREWIVVGFGEGSVGYTTLTQKQEDGSSTSQKEITRDGRVAFFAKGSIRGEWLLSMAYDSGKEKGDKELFSKIDPNSYYTLYNDASRENYEASSTKKIYLKIEKDRFYALFGDYSTALSYTELSRYSRSFTGLKSEYSGDNFQTNLFVANTDQLFVKDEIRGDGTSGDYKLSKDNIVINSEKVSIEVRDRLRDQIIVSRKTLQRFRDYEIDYGSGTIKFKRAIFGSDSNFNPQFIVIDYEVDGDEEQSYTYGGRVAVSTSSKNLELGGTYIKEDRDRSDSLLMGVDSRVNIGEHTQIRAEYAQTTNTKDNNSTTADASLLSIEHVDSGVYVRAYYKEQRDAFGLSQISTSQRATRKIGVDTNKRILDRVSLSSSMYRDTQLQDKIDQDVVEAKVSYDDLFWQNYLGLRYAKTTDKDSTQQLLFGLSRSFFNHSLRLSVSHERSLQRSQDDKFPTRTLLGIKYSLTSTSDIFLNFERVELDDSKKDSARAGVRVRPWSGATLSNAAVSEFDRDQTRLFNTLGIQQNVPITKNVSIILGYERAQEFSESNGSSNADYSAYSAGISYNQKSYTTRVDAELRESAQEEKINADASIYTQASTALALALGAGYSKQSQAHSHTQQNSTRFSLAYRPRITEWIVFDKLEYKYKEEYASQQSLTTTKFINNLHLNYTPHSDFEVSFQYGFKHVIDNIDSVEYRSYVDLLSGDIRYDLTRAIEIGVHTSILHSYSANNYDYSSGLYLGYNIFANTYLGVGYNFDGFNDSDFELQNYRKEGPYIRFRIKVDQQSLRDLLRVFGG